MKAVCLNDWTTARETWGGQILLFTPSDETEAGHISPPNQIYLKRSEIRKLAEFAGFKVSELPDIDEDAENKRPIDQEPSPFQDMIDNTVFTYLTRKKVR